MNNRLAKWQFNVLLLISLLVSHPTHPFSKIRAAYVELTKVITEDLIPLSFNNPTGSDVSNSFAVLIGSFTTFKLIILAACSSGRVAQRTT